MGGTREIRKVYFENFRIPLDNPEILQELGALAEEIIAAKKRGESSAGLGAADKKLDTIEVRTCPITPYHR